MACGVRSQGEMTIATTTLERPAPRMLLLAALPARVVLTMPPPELVTSAASASDASDASAIQRIVAGDAQAFREVFAAYAPVANALARRILRQPALAEEVVQEVFIGVWDAPERFEPARGSLRAWIMTQVHHRAVDAVRKEETERRHSTAAGIRDAAMPGDDPGETVPASVDLPEERLKLRAALEGISSEQQEVLQLMYFEGLSQTAVAARLDVPLGTVKSRASMGMRHMKSAIGGWES